MIEVKEHLINWHNNIKINKHCGNIVFLKLKAEFIFFFIVFSSSTYYVYIIICEKFTNIKILNTLLQFFFIWELWLRKYFCFISAETKCQALLYFRYYSFVFNNAVLSCNYFRYHQIEDKFSQLYVSHVGLSANKKSCTRHTAKKKTCFIMS